jgi:S1-C subfamily serine protease
MYRQDTSSIFGKDYIDATVAVYVNNCTFKVCFSEKHLGSCFSFDNEHLLTCCHVVRDVSPSERLTITQDDDTWNVDVVYKSTRFDVAVLQFADPSPIPAKMLKISQEDLDVGTIVFGCGYASAARNVLSGRRQLCSQRPKFSNV